MNSTVEAIKTYFKGVRTEWGKVNYNGVTGYCSMRYLEEV